MAGILAASRAVALSALKTVDGYTLDRLASVAPKLSEAIRRFPSIQRETIVTEIEQIRERLLADSHPLAAGDPAASENLARQSDESASIAMAARASAPPKTLQLLFSLCREYHPNRAIELGTNVGISSAYLAAGMSGGILHTLEKSPDRLRIAQAIHKELGIDRVRYSQGLFTDTLEKTLEELGPVDMAFIDGHHQFRATLDYFERIWRRSQDGCVFVFDDIRWSESMKQAWKSLRRDPRIKVAVDLRRLAICVGTRSPSSRTPTVFSPRWTFRG